MDLDRDACYRALLTRDARFDGHFFTCVLTTRIYCRPICPARPPKLANCVFLPSAAAAQAAGFRPCLRCRPEASPDLALWRGTSNTVSRALALIADGALDEQDVGELGERPGMGERHLRRLFQHHLGAPKASRAVGLANGANPVAIIVPCHRVIGSDGGLTGYGGGLPRKRWLLDHEGAAFRARPSGAP
jgi:AraC family transcriptional regulator of adaptative response / DNA-3-methyladenine glycosylase II